MKKIYAFSFLFLTALTTLTAQQATTRKKSDWGIKTGLNFSNIRMEEGADSDWKTGLAIGVFFKIKAGNSFAIQPEFLYSSMGGKSIGGFSESSLRLNYFSLPVLGRFQIKKNFAVVAGPQIDVLIQAKTKTTSGLSKVTDNYKENSYYGTAGFEFWPLHCFGITARYQYGFNNILPESSSTTSQKNQGVQLMAALKL